MEYRLYNSREVRYGLQLSEDRVVEVTYYQTNGGTQEADNLPVDKMGLKAV